MKLTTNDKPTTRSIWAISVFLSHGLPVLQAGEISPVKVETYAQHVGANIVNHYILTNNSGREIINVSVGYYTTNLDLGAGRTELMTLPAGSYFEDDGVLVGGINNGPTTWQPTLRMQESSANIAYTWEASSPSDVMRIGSSLRFSLASTKRDMSYLTRHFSVNFNFDDIKPRRYTALMELIDRKPPVLSLAATPSQIWPPNNKLVPVNVTVNVTDDYDNAPEIVLESITANEVLAQTDIVGAELGKDDRAFNLMATREGSNKAGRIYTITYAAIDASGNKSTASFDVVVPHDQRK